MRLAMESRKRVKDQLARIDSTYPEVDFHYAGTDGEKRSVTTVEEEEYPQFYNKGSQNGADGDGTPLAVTVAEQQEKQPAGERNERSDSTVEVLSEGHHLFAENRKGVTYDKLFGAYMSGAKRIIVEPILISVSSIRSGI